MFPVSKRRPATSKHERRNVLLFLLLLPIPGSAMASLCYHAGGQINCPPGVAPGSNSLFFDAFGNPVFPAIGGGNITIPVGTITPYTAPGGTGGAAPPLAPGNGTSPPASSSGMLQLQFNNPPATGGCLITNVKSSEACTAIKDNKGHTVAYGGGGGEDNLETSDAGSWVDGLGEPNASSGPGRESPQAYGFPQEGVGEYAGSPVDATPAPLQVADSGQPAGDTTAPSGGPTVTTDNGWTTKNYPDGSTETLSPDGVKTTALPDGTKIVNFTDGSTSTTDPATGMTVTISGNYKITNFPDGSTTVEHADGSPGWKTTTLADGTRIEDHTDGTHLVTSPDGTRTGVENNADGSKTVYNADGTKSTIPPPQPPQPVSSGDPKVSFDANGNKISQYSNGATITDFKGGGSSIDLGNGTVESKDANGNKTLVNPDKSTVTENAQTGDVTRTSPDGKTWATTSGDGKTVTSGAPGVVTTVTTEGDTKTVQVTQGGQTTTVTQTPDGSTRVNPDGSTEEVNYHDNTKTVTAANGTVTVDNGDGTKTTSSVPQTVDRGPAPGTGTTTGGTPAAPDNPATTGGMVTSTTKDIATTSAEEYAKRNGLRIPGTDRVSAGKTGELISGQTAEGGSALLKGIGQANTMVQFGNDMNNALKTAATERGKIQDKIDVYSSPTSFNRPDSGGTLTPGSVTQSSIHNTLAPMQGTIGNVLGDYKK